ncbi:hypothetical protein C8R44DRAFT_377597 [Mycena epipterygia]|nr:hypothetical protein C8R44DRAFT_377597 [Mycena epipterygia]
MSRISPSSRARRRIVCILPPAPASVPSDLRPTRSRSESEKSTLLPYYRDGSDAPSIRYQCNPTPELSPELRRPPVDPRKSRRYCTDFGFGRTLPIYEDPLPLPPPFMYHHDNSSSAGSTPQATYAETESDASSFYQDLDLEFPQPPASPALRRMQSSPLFTPDETNAVREFLRKRWGTVKASQDVRSSPAVTARISEQELSDFSWDAESPECGVEAGPDTRKCTNAPVDIDLELQGEALIQAGASRRYSWLQLDDNVYNVPHLCPKRSAIPPLPTARVLRRAASMASPTTAELQNAQPPPQRSLRFQENPSGDVKATPGSRQPYPPSLASAGRQKPHHRPNLSVPLMGLGLPNADPNALGPSFRHRPALSQPTNFHRARADNPKSFIDLTPEKIAQRESSARVHRDRVKKLLSRASSGIIGWSKGLTGKKTRS